MENGSYYFDDSKIDLYACLDIAEALECLESIQFLFHPHSDNTDVIAMEGGKELSKLEKRQLAKQRERREKEWAEWEEEMKHNPNGYQSIKKPDEETKKKYDETIKRKLAEQAKEKEIKEEAIADANRRQTTGLIQSWVKRYRAWAAKRSNGYYKVMKGIDLKQVYHEMDNCIDRACDTSINQKAREEIKKFGEYLDSHLEKANSAKTQKKQEWVMDSQFVQKTIDRISKYCDIRKLERMTGEELYNASACTQIFSKMMQFIDKVTRPAKSGKDIIKDSIDNVKNAGQRFKERKEYNKFLMDEAAKKKGTYKEEDDEKPGREKPGMKERLT